jgi:hypothetical protein
MPNSAYLDGQYFDPETKRIMGVAFEIARAAHRLAGQDDFAPETIARKNHRTCEGRRTIAAKVIREARS